MADLTFYGYRRSQAANDATPQGGRLMGKLPLTLADLHGAGAETLPVSFLLMGPSDVRGLSPDAVRRTYPVDGARDVETDKCVHAEFAADDLPWRYSPERNGAAMKPWLLLLVGTTDELTLLPGRRVALSQRFLADRGIFTAAGHATRPHLWAHVQDHENTTVGRLLSPRALEPDRSYAAVLVPAFDGSGPRRFRAGEALPAYHSWRFTTSTSEGSFRELAVRLHPLSPIPPNVGMAPMAYQTRSDEESLQATLLVGGALVGVTATPPEEALPPLPDEVIEHFAPLRPTADTTFRDDDVVWPIVELPLYGAPWLPPGEVEAAWMKELNDDPRLRGAAGLGVWAGIEWQERIVRAASTKLGAFFTASRRIRQLTVGLAAARSLWQRRLPEDPLHRLHVLGLAMPRLAAAQGGSVLDHATAAGRPLPPALFSSAARRMLRPGTALARLAEPGAFAPGALLERMNRCPPDRREHPGGLPHTSTLVDGDMHDEIEARLARGGFPLDHGAAEQWAAVDGEGSEEWERVEEGLDSDAGWFGLLRDLGERDELQRALLDAVHAPYPTRPCEDRNTDLARLSAILAQAFDPHGDAAFVIGRVLRTIRGLDDQPLTPPELCLDFDIPAWMFLRDAAKDWFLPGLAQMHVHHLDEAGRSILDDHGHPLPDEAKDPVIAASTNGRFSDAFLIGFNQQALAELRWRNVPVASGCTPLRRFWEPIRPQPPVADGQAGTDIIGIDAWASESTLGDEQHETPEARGANLVLIFKSRLWRRYPETLIYLVPDVDGNPDWTAAHVEPNLQIEIERDVVGFGFAESPAILDTHWVVIEQVPRGFAFRNLATPEGRAANAAGNGAEFAKRAFAQPVRVLIRGTELKPQT